MLGTVKRVNFGNSIQFKVKTKNKNKKTEDPDYNPNKYKPIQHAAASCR